MEEKKDIRVLIVEDDKFLLDTMAKRFSENGFTLDYASDGDKALETAKRFRPHVIILDILLPHKDGFQILEEIKKDDELKRVPVIFVSNLGTQEDIDRGKKLGAFSFLIKATVTIDEIIREVKKALIS